MSLFTGQHRRLILRTIHIRYPYLAVMLAGVVAVPAPVNRDVLLACIVFALLANALAHVYIRVTGEHKWSGLAMAMADAGVSLVAIRNTGMLTSPFLIFFPVAMFSAHFLFLERRAAVIFEAAGITAYMVLAGLCLKDGCSLNAWTAAEYPLFTAGVGLMNLLAVAGYVGLAFDAGFLVGGLERQRAAVSARDEKERLGRALLSAAEELRARLEEMKAARARAGESLATVLRESADEATELNRRCREHETEMEDLLDGTIAYARERVGKPRFAPVPVADLLREAASFTRLRHGAGPEEVRLGSGVAGLGTANLDRTWILQALADLAGDAFGRRQSGRPFAVEFDGVERGPTLVLTVRDNGRELLPGEFAAMSGAGTPEEPGVTAGSTRMARRILEEHGGGLTLDSRPGRGVSFFVILPRDHPEGR